ncbi:MoxR family ATPase (plasmid) [Halorubrum sp. BOL3-1]|uniref:AAA family ATPase n=1 Tax=Halorubrum sp. BOL3-1 TaxID=2497325 RepID=UPI001004F7F9|nr:MoxR family ATPase [Halorubrum sp. BOL3-1]QAU11340.1 MoxR family ATPase [Halorubrum sp. BOL3-1]
MTSSPTLVGEPTGESFRELTTLADVGHQHVPTIKQETYHERTGDSDRTDVEIVTRALELGMNVVLKGNPGVGKSFLIRYLCAQTNRPLYRMTLSQTTYREDLVGHLHLVSGENGETVTEWVDGPLTRAAREGGILLLDEINAADANTVAALNSVMESRGTRTLTLPQTGEQITPHEEFRVAATANPGFQGTYELNDAFEDRFRHIELEYLPVDVEVDLILEQSQLDSGRREEITRLVEFAERLREAYREGELSTPITTRELIRIAQFMADDFMPLRDAVRSELVARVDEYDESLVRTLIDTQL